jgi:predicted transport protein
MNLERPQHLYEHLIAGLTGLEPAILGLTNLRYIPLKLQTNIVDPVGIEPTPLVLQTSVRTSYTKGPILTTA